ncbi:MAG: lipid-A-disaccharide synthase [Rhodocyclaceae bacterium]|nr:lipid-A-disaccharide synthase [Rhodocyclaceae bacterium]
MPPRIAMVAGEASGDLLAGHLIGALRRRLPDAEFVGIGGPRMEAAGFEAWWPAERLAVRGYAEVLRHYRGITRIRRQLLARLLRERPQVFIGVDAPDFNLWLEARLRRAGIPAVHYVSPSIWAWRRGRLPKIARAVSHVLALFPFEPEIYRGAGVPVTYVGHPLADVIPVEIDLRAARDKLAIHPAGPVIALLPGSRQSELQYMAGLYVETAMLLHQRFPAAQFLVPLVSRETRAIFEEAMWSKGAQELPFKLLFGHAQDALAAADGALVASGTATLEAALTKTPMVIAYRMSPWSWRLMRRMRYQPWVGLPNILAGRFVVPEFLQDDATPENLAQALGNLVEDRRVADGLRETYRAIHLTLRQDTATRAADAVVSCLAPP